MVIPSNDLPIETVLTKDAPIGAIIVDFSTLPQGSDAQFFDAWELNGTTISVNINKAKEIYLNNFNNVALQIAQKRQLNTLAGITNSPDDNTFIANLNNSRNSIASATTTDQLLSINLPTIGS